MTSYLSPAMYSRVLTVKNSDSDPPVHVPVHTPGLIHQSIVATHQTNARAHVKLYYILFLLVERILLRQNLCIIVNSCDLSTVNSEEYVNTSMNMNQGQQQTHQASQAFCLYFYSQAYRHTHAREPTQP